MLYLYFFLFLLCDLKLYLCEIYINFFRYCKQKFILGEIKNIKEKYEKKNINCK